MQRLNRDAFPGAQYPDRVIQFGEGNFLRAFIDWLDRQPQVDARRGIGTTGYCMGGPMTMLTATERPDRVRYRYGTLDGETVEGEAASPQTPALLRPLAASTASSRPPKARLPACVMPGATLAWPARPRKARGPAPHVRPPAQAGRARATSAPTISAAISTRIDDAAAIRRPEPRAGRAAIRRTWRSCAPKEAPIVRARSR